MLHQPFCLLRLGVSAVRPADPGSLAGADGEPPRPFLL